MDIDGVPGPQIYPSLIACTIQYGPRREKTCLQGFANNKRTEQTADPGRLITAFVILVLGSTLSKFAISKRAKFTKGKLGPVKSYLRNV